MNIKEFIKENQEDIIDYIISIMDKKVQYKSPSIKLKFRALGKSYDSDKSVQNYVDFIKDLSSIHSYETLESVLKSYVGKSREHFSEDQRPSVIEIKDNIYLTKKISNKTKEYILNNISETLDIPIIKI